MGRGGNIEMENLIPPLISIYLGKCLYILYRRTERTIVKDLLNLYIITYIMLQHTLL